MSRKARKQHRKAVTRANTIAQNKEQTFLDIPDYFKPLEQKRGIQLLDWVSQSQQSNPRYYFDIRSGTPYEVIYSSFDAIYTARKLKQDKLKALLKTSSVSDITGSLRNRDETSTLAQRWLRERPVSLEQKQADTLNTLHQSLSQHVSLVIIMQLTEVLNALFDDNKNTQQQMTNSVHKSPVSLQTIRNAYVELLRLLTDINDKQPLKSTIKAVQAIAVKSLTKNDVSLKFSPPELDEIMLLCTRLNHELLLDQLAPHWSQPEKAGLALILGDLDALKFALSESDDTHQIRLALSRVRRENKAKFIKFIEHRMILAGYTLNELAANVERETPLSPKHNPITKPLTLFAICMLAIPLIWLCSSFYGEQNIHSGSWIFGGISDVLLPLWIYVIFRHYRWSHWPSASKLCIVIILLIVIPGHFIYFQDSVKYMAGAYRTQYAESPENITHMSDKEMFSEFIKPTIKRSSGSLFLDNLRYRASVGTVAEEKAWIYGPYIDVHRQGFWVWFNWCFQVFSLWLLCAIAFMFANQKRIRHSVNT